MQGQNNNKKLSYSEKLKIAKDNNFNLVGYRLACRPSKYKFRKDRKPLTQEEKQKASNNCKVLRLERKAAGLDRDGFIKEDTLIFFPELLKCDVFKDHPIFEGASVPFLVLRKVPMGLVDILSKIEDEIEEVITTKKNKFEGHKYGANEGLNLGIALVSGGVHASQEKSISGSIHRSRFAKEQPIIYGRLYEVFRSILEHSFGHCAWYRRMVALTEKLAKDTNGELRTIPGLPISGLWLTCNPKPENKHCDRNVVGATFLITTKYVQGSTLCLTTPNGKIVKRRINPGTIMAGRWAENVHYNEAPAKDSASGTRKRTSWTLYLDYRVFFQTYKCIDY